MTRIREGLIALTLVLGLAAAQGFFLKSALDEQNRQMVRIIQKTVGRLSEHAHRVNDDLSLQAVIQGLSQGPGILFACITDASGTILAHSEPSLLGHPFRHAPRAKPEGLWRSRLVTETEPWGHLIFQVTGRPVQTFLFRQFLLIGMGILVLVVWAGHLWTRWETLYRQEKQRADEIALIEKSHEAEIERLTEDRQISLQLWTGWLQGALEQAPQPVLLLDAYQKVVALNASVRTHLSLPPDKTLVGLSWQDLPVLAACGPALQQSLECPGTTVQTRVKEGSIQLAFLSSQSPEKLLAGTWVFLHTVPKSTDNPSAIIEL